jgi:hypothetical protein
VAVVRGLAGRDGGRQSLSPAAVISFPLLAQLVCFRQISAVQGACTLGCDFAAAFFAPLDGTAVARALGRPCEADGRVLAMVEGPMSARIRRVSRLGEGQDNRVADAHLSVLDLRAELRSLGTGKVCERAVVLHRRVPVRHSDGRSRCNILAVPRTQLPWPAVPGSTLVLWATTDWLGGNTSH